MAVPGGLFDRCCYVWLTCASLAWIVHYSTGYQLTALAVTAAALLSAAVVYVSFLQVDAADRAVLITGCSSGFGYRLAKELHAAGFTVFAGFHCADGASADQLRSLGGRLHVLQLDITRQEQVDQAVRYVRSHLPARGLWSVVNNAGVVALGFAEWLPIELYNKIVDVNLNGTVRMTMAFLPLLRKSGGRLVNVTSGGGRVPLIFHGAYVASKFAVEGFSDVLRVELKSVGVTVCLVEPCNFTGGTRILRGPSVAVQIRQFWDRVPLANRHPYTKQHVQRCVTMCQSFLDSGASDITPAVDALKDSVCRKYPRSRYVAGSLSAKMMVLILPHLPEFATDFLFHKLLPLLISGS